MDLLFSYSGIAEWSAVNNENDLILCYWSGTQWEAASNQDVYTGVDSIRVRGFSKTDWT